MGKGKNLILPCRYNIGVNCEAQKNCLVCGWNPSVEARRKEALRNPPVKTEHRPAYTLLGRGVFRKLA